MGKIHLSENFVSFEVYYIVKLFLLQGRHGSESSSDENTQGLEHDQDKGKKSKKKLEQIGRWFRKLFRQQTNEAKSRATLLAADYSLSVVLEARVY